MCDEDEDKRISLETAQQMFQDMLDNIGIVFQIPQISIQKKALGPVQHQNV